MNVTELFLIAMTIILGVPYLIWRVFRTDYWAPLVVVQIVTGIVLGPGVLGKIFPEYYATVFAPPVIAALNGIAWWAVMVFVWIAGIELDLREVWRRRRECGGTDHPGPGGPGRRSVERGYHPHPRRRPRRGQRSADHGDTVAGQCAPDLPRRRLRNAPDTRAKATDLPAPAGLTLSEGARTRIRAARRRVRRPHGNPAPRRPGTGRRRCGARRRCGTAR